MSSFSPKPIRSIWIRLLTVFLCASCLFLPRAAAASKFKVLYSFKGSSDGAFPSGALFLGSEGHLYGTTFSGGINAGCSGYNGTGCGTVFQLTPQQIGEWRKKTLHRFRNGADGGNPNGSLISAAGNLYGTTLIGGEGIAYGCGTIFKMAAHPGNWTESVAYTFCSVSGDADGSFPNAGLIQDPSGNLYGTTLSGGSALGGIAFELIPGGDELTSTALYDFCVVDCTANGSNPAAGLVPDTAGNFYGTTTQGGNPDRSCGGFPGGCGVVFKLTRDSHGNWNQSVIYAFHGPDGVQPGTRLILDSHGSLYGTTSGGGAFGFGTAFRLMPAAHGSWKYSVLYNFRTGYPGDNLSSGLLIDSTGNLYGAIGTGGIGKCPAGGCGLVYKVTPQKNGRWKFTALHEFTGGSDGGQPSGELIFDRQGNLYGNAGLGGASGGGTVFEITP